MVMTTVDIMDLIMASVIDLGTIMADLIMDSVIDLDTIMVDGMVVDLTVDLETDFPIDEEDFGR